MGRERVVKEPWDAPKVGPRGLHLRVRCPTAPRLELRRPRRGRRAVGDMAFDGVFEVLGPLDRARGVLTAEVRAAALALARFEVVRVRLTATGCSFFVDACSPPPGLVAAVSSFLEAVPLVRADWARLLEVALDDPELRVRAGAAEAVLSMVPGLEAAVAETVCVALITSSAVRPRLRVDALWQLEQRSTRAAELWPQLVDSSATDLAAHALSRFAEHRPQEARAAVLAALEDARAPVREAALRGLVYIGEEPRLCRLLDHADPGTVVAAAEALGAKSRSTRSARQLERVMTRVGVRVIRLAAQAALTRVKSRLPGPGTLALVEPPADGGTLSITRDLASTSTTDARPPPNA